MGGEDMRLPQGKGHNDFDTKTRVPPMNSTPQTHAETILERVTILFS